MITINYPITIHQFLYGLDVNINIFENDFSYISELSSIKDLEVDPYLHGAALHCHPRLGRLNLHLDYEKHSRLYNKERRLNIILYLNKDWKEEWNGDTQLWNKDVSKISY